MPPKGIGNSKSRCRAEDPTSNCIFPREIVFIILSRVPVKSLLRFRCVCKPWLKLISKPNFIAAHFKYHSSYLQPNTLLLQSHHCEYSRLLPNRHNHLCESSDFVPSLFNTSEPSVTELDNAVPLSHMVVGSCNGIVCLFKPPRADEITLWNPAMKQSRTLNFEFPFAKRAAGKFSCISIGLAYDSQADEFFILLIWTFLPLKPNFNPNGVEMYSLSSSSWTELRNDLRVLVIRPYCNVIIKGVPYWIAESEDEHGSRDLLVFFDARQKVIDKLPMPGGVGLELNRCLVDLKDSLCMITWDKNEKSYLDVWVMDNEDGWNMKCNVGPLFWFDNVIGCSKNGDIVAENDEGELLLFDPFTSLVKFKAKLWDNAKQAKHLVFNYSESLVLITGMVAFEKEAARDNLAHENLLEAGMNSKAISSDNLQQTAG